MAIIALTSASNSAEPAYVVPGGLGILAVLWVWLEVAIGRCAARIRVIEQKINEATEPSS